MKTHYLKMTALSPIHVGNGEEYIPINFIIDDGYLYEFDEISFYRELSPADQRAFNTIVSQNGSDTIFKIHTFVKEHKEKAMFVAHNKVSVSKGIADHYRTKIGTVVQQEGKGRNSSKNVFNQFEIIRVQRLDNLSSPYIPGSSLKGSLSTAFQEGVFKNNPQEWKEQFTKVNPTASTFKNILVSDLLPVSVTSKIGYSLNKERFEDDTQGPTNKLEIIEPNSVFIGTISFKDLEPNLHADIHDFASEANRHYKANLDSLFNPKERLHTYIDRSFATRCNELNLSEERFLLRVGRHSGARAMTLEGNREIEVKKSGKKWETLEEETTTWLFGDFETQLTQLLPFGWLLCEIISQEEYKQLSQNRDELLQQTKNFIVSREQAYLNAKMEKESARIESENKKAKEEQDRIQREHEEAQRLASLSPVDLLLDQYNLADLINKMKQGELENYDSIKIELATKIKSILQSNPDTWDKAKKKALDRKEFILSILP